MPAHIVIKEWLWEAVTNYRLAVWRLGIVQVVLGSCSIILGGVFMTISSGDLWAGLGLWCGIPFVAAGAFCIKFRSKREKRKSIPALILSAISAVVAIFLFITCIYNIHQATETIFLSSGISKGAVLGVNSLLLILAVAEAAVSCWAASLLFGAECRCFQQRAGIFTIPYDAVYDEPLPVDGHGMLAMEDVTSDRIVTLNRQKSSHNQQRAPLPEDPVLFTIDEVDDSITELPIPNGSAKSTA